METLKQPAGPLPLQTQTQAPLSSSSGEPIPDPLAMAMAIKAKAEQDRKWASWVNEEYQKCKNARVPFERQWYLNLAFVMGKHYVAPIDVAGHGFRLTAPKAPPHRVRFIANKIRMAVRTECAKLTASKPIPVVIPATNEDEDYSAAAVGEQILKAKFSTAEFGEMFRDHVWWGVVTGNSFIKSYWSASDKDYDSMQLPTPPNIPGTNEPFPQELISQLPADVQEYLATPQPARGKICMERITPFHLYVPDLLSPRLEAQPYIIQVMTRSPHWVEKSFGFKPVADSRAASTIMESVTVIAKNSEQHLDSVLVKEMWIKPGAHTDFPEGGVLTVVNDRIVQSITKWPLKFEEFPFYRYRGIPTGGFYDDSIVVDLIPLQKEYNRTKSQMIEIKNTMGKPRLVYQQGSINPRQISSEPGQSVSYVAGYGPPIVMPGVEVPQSMSAELDRITSDFDDISGQHEITRGNSPSQVTSGTAIAFLQEQDDTKLSYQFAGIEASIELLGKHYLSYVSTYWDDNRVVKVAGRNSSYEAIYWKKNMLRGNTDVRVQSGSALPFSKAAKQAMITEYMQLGFMSPEVGMEILDLGGFEKALDGVLTDKRQAQRENLKMADTTATKMFELLMSPAPGPNGEPPVDMVLPDGTPVQRNGDGTPFIAKPPIPVNSWDNNEAHIEYHNHFRKTQEFELLPEANKKAFELHVQMHQMALQSNLTNMQGQVVQENVPPPPPAIPGMEGQEGGTLEDGEASSDSATGKEEAPFQ